MDDPILVLGDSIPAGSWLDDPARDCILTRLQTRLTLAGDPRRIVDRTVGGTPLHDPKGNTAATVVGAAQRAKAEGMAYSAAVVMAGTNDLTTHEVGAELTKSKWAAIDVDVVLESMGVPQEHRLWTSVLPMGRDFNNPWRAHPDAWLPNLTARWRDFTGWQRAMWEPRGQFVGFAGLFHEDKDGLVPDHYAYLFTDGLHPSRYGALDVADAFPLERL